MTARPWRPTSWAQSALENASAPSASLRKKLSLERFFLRARCATEKDLRFCVKKTHAWHAEGAFVYFVCFVVSKILAVLFV